MDKRKIRGNNKPRGLYAYEFSDNSVYVGLTYCYRRRKYDHSKRENSTVYKKALTCSYTYREYGIFYPVDIAPKKECELIEYYKLTGWKILNKVKGGSLGGNMQKYSDFELVESAKKYKNFASLNKKEPAIYQACYKRGLFQELEKFLKKKRAKWSTNELMHIIKDCKSVSDIRELGDHIYLACTKDKKIHKYMIENLIYERRHNGYWTIERSLNVAYKCKTVTEFQRKHGAAYACILRNNLLHKVYDKIGSPQRPRGYWTFENCAEEAKNHRNASQMNKDMPTAYQRARQQGFAAKLKPYYGLNIKS